MPLIDDISNKDVTLTTPLVDDVEVDPVENTEDIFSEKMPPLYSFGDGELFKQKVEKDGLSQVTKDIVESFVKPKISHFNFTYEQLKDGSADVLDVINPTELPTQTRAMSDEAILALFTDVEDFGKYDTPTQAKNEDGSPKFNTEGKPVMEKNRYNLTAFAEGAKPAIVEGGFMTIGGWQGARLGAAAYASRVPQTGVRPLDVGGKAVAATLGAVVGSGILMKPAEYINEWLFEEPDPIVVPSLQAAYNAGETTAYGISFLATPWVGTKLAGPKLSATFNATKTLENFKTISSSKYKPDELVKKFGQELVDKANKASQKQASKGPIAKALTTDATLGPVGARISTAITTGGAAALEVARNNPKSFIGVESLMSVFGGLSAYGSEKLAPGNEGVRFGMELISAPIALKTIPPITGAAKKTYNVVKKVFEGGVTDANGVGNTRLESEARKRINEELRNSPEFLESPDSEADMLEAIDALLNFKGEDETLPSEILNRPVFGKNKDAPSPLASKFLDIEDQLSTRQDDIAVATVKGKDRFLAQAKMNIMKLRESRSPEAFQLAAHVEQRVFEQEMIDEIEIANQKLIDASEKLFGNSEIAPQDVELSERFYDLQLRLVAGLKAKRDKLYKLVPDFDVRSFSLADGTKVRQPNSLTIFDIPTNQGGLKFNSKGATADFKRIIGSYKDDFAEMDAYFNPEVDADNMIIGEIPDFPVQFSRLREMSQHFKSLKAERIKVNPSDSMATHIDSLIKAIDQDMNGMDATGVFLTPDGELLTPDQQSIVKAYNTAKAYNFGLHNVTSRTYISEFSKQNAQRGMVLNPTESVNALKKGDDIPLTRINEMQGAVKFLINNASDIDTISYTNKSTGQRYNDVKFDTLDTGLELNEIFELVIRDARKNIVDTKVDPKTNELVRTVNAKKLEQYKNRPETKELFRIFPSIAKDLLGVEEAQALVNASRANKKSLLNTPEQKAFKLFLDKPESAGQVIGQILSGSKVPAKQALQQMIDKIKFKGTFDQIDDSGKVVKTYTSEEVLSGLMSSIINYAVIKSGGSGVGFSPDRLYDTLFADVASVDPSAPNAGLKLIKFMQANGVVDQQYVDDLQKAISQMRNVEEGLANKDLSSTLFKRPSIFSMASYRVGGAMAGSAALSRFKKVASKFGIDLSGAGLVVGQTGAAVGEKMFLVGPESITINNMAKIMSNPKILAKAIQEHSSPQSFIKGVTAVNVMLGNIAISAAPKVARDLNADESFIRPFDAGDREADYTKQRSQGELLKQEPPVAQPVAQPVAPPAQEVTQLQGPKPPPTPASAPVAPTTAPSSGPVDRSRFAAMFPNDIASGLIKQGIGSIPA